LGRGKPCAHRPLSQQQETKRQMERCWENPQIQHAFFDPTVPAHSVKPAKRFAGLLGIARGAWAGKEFGFLTSTIECGLPLVSNLFAARNRLGSNDFAIRNLLGR
jgi:hypothetical protein